MHFFNNKVNRLYIILAAFFLTNAIVAEFMGVKIFNLDATIGIPTFTFNFFGETIPGFNLTCGVLLWPFVFIMTDIINEYFGTKGVRFLSILAAFMIGYAFFMLYGAMATPAAGWWVFSSNYGNEVNMDKAYNAVFGQGTNIIIASLTAFIVGQVVDVSIFHWIKKKTGEKYIWLRSTGSTVVSQLIDSFVVLFIAFYLLKRGQNGQWSLQLVLAVCCVNYIYKFTVAILLTPVLYLVHGLIDKYLGEELATQLKKQAVENAV
jgi:uncharacterized integral membrane protein (TIGR00697 family)